MKTEGHFLEKNLPCFLAVMFSNGKAVRSELWLMKMICFCGPFSVGDREVGSGLRMFGMIPNVQENIGKCITDNDKARLWWGGGAGRGPMQSSMNWENKGEKDENGLFSGRGSVISSICDIEERV